MANIEMYLSRILLSFLTFYKRPVIGLCLCNIVNKCNNLSACASIRFTQAPSTEQPIHWFRWSWLTYLANCIDSYNLQSKLNGYVSSLVRNIKTLPISQRHMFSSQFIGILLKCWNSNIVPYKILPCAWRMRASKSHCIDISNGIALFSLFTTCCCESVSHVKQENHFQFV